MALSKELSDATETAKAQRARSDSLQKTVATLRENAESAKQKIAELRSEHELEKQRLVEESEELKEQYKAMETMYGDLQAKYEALITTERNQRDELKDLQQKFDELKAKQSSIDTRSSERDWNAAVTTRSRTMTMNAKFEEEALSRAETVHSCKLRESKAKPPSSSKPDWTATRTRSRGQTVPNRRSVPNTGKCMQMGC